MDFMAKECIFLTFFCLSLGAFGDVIEPFMQNIIQTAGRYTEFVCSSTELPSIFNWSMWPVGGQRLRGIMSGDLVVDPDFTSIVGVYSTASSSIGVNIVNVSTAGVYNCDEGQKQSAQLIVLITEEPACNLKPKPNEGRSGDEISELSCTLKYAANASYVVANMKWSIRGSLESLNSSTKTSTSANITTATSTLKNVTRSLNDTCFICTTIFSLTDNLPRGFATKMPFFPPTCTPTADACQRNPCLQGNGGCEHNCNVDMQGVVNCSCNEGFILVSSNGTCLRKYEKPSKPPIEPPIEPPRKLFTKPTRKPSGKVHGGNSDEESGENSDEASGENSDEEPDNNASGLSFGSSKRNIVIKCIVGISGFLLIGIGTGV